MSTIKEFEKRLNNELLNHEVIHDNKYCDWFELGNATIYNVRYLIQQFSVFSNEFIVAQLRKVLNAPTLDEMRTGKIILMNELGVPFKGESVQDSPFKFEAAHFEWLVRLAKPLNIGFDQMGKREFANEHTLHFCNELIRIYGSEDYITGIGSSYAIENWAASGFWKQLIRGMEEFSLREKLNLHLGFFTWHDKVEDSHAHATQIEMRQFFTMDDFNEDKFINAGNEILDACKIFWDGLNQNRLARM